MKTLWLVATRELQAYFATWTGYVICALALLIDGLLFTAFAVGRQPKYSADVLHDFFYFSSGMTMVAGLLLAMRLIAEERQSGTLVLFLTSPVSERQWVYGKFLSVCVLLLILHLLSLYLPALIYVYGKVSLGHLVSGYLCLVLLGSACAALALFASSLAHNQMMAAIFGGSMLAVFIILWMLAAVFEPPLKHVLSYLSIHNQHFRPFAQGIVHSRDVVFYLSFTCFFLECAVRSLEARRWKG